MPNPSSGEPPKRSHSAAVQLASPGAILPPPAEPNTVAHASAARPVHLRLRARPNDVVFVVARSAISHPPSDAALGLAPTLRTRERRRRARSRLDPDALPPPVPAAPLLCPAFAALGRCAAGDACPDVHATLVGATVLYPHVRPGLGLPPGRPAPQLPAQLGQLRVAAPNDPAAVSWVPAASCLHTRALVPCTGGHGGSPTSRVPSLCAHFAKKGVCDYGAACVFVHCVDVPPPGCDPQQSTAATMAGSDDGRVSLVTQYSPAVSQLGSRNDTSTTSVDSEAKQPHPVPQGVFRRQHDPYSTRCAVWSR